MNYLQRLPVRQVAGTEGLEQDSIKARVSHVRLLLSLQLAADTLKMLKELKRDLEKLLLKYKSIRLTIASR